MNPGWANCFAPLRQPGGIPGSLIDGRGFPYKIFVVGFPAKTDVVNWKLVASEANGKQDGVPFPVASAF